MDVTRREPKPSPLEKANFFSKHFLVWFWPIFKIGARRPLGKDDLWDPPSDDKAQKNADSLESAWNAFLEGENVRLSSDDPEQVKFIPGQGKKPKDPKSTENNDFMCLLSALKATFGTAYFRVWPLIIFNDCFLRVVQPWFMLLLIRTFIEDKVDVNAQYWYAGGSMVRISDGGQQTNQGQITTLISNDAGCVEQNLMHIPYLLVAPLQLIIFMSFLWFEFDWNGTLSSLYRNKIGQRTDERTRTLTEVIDGITSLKMYAWEEIFKAIVQDRRKAEVKELRRRSRLHAFQMSIFLTSSRIVPFLTFLMFVLWGGPLTADRVFYAIAVYNTVTHYMVFLVPGGIRAIGEIKGSLQRIQTFLMLEEKPDNGNSYKRKAGQSPEIKLSEVSASWSRSNGRPVLSNVTCELVQNKLVLIVGRIGSGKTSLLRLILNELQITGGNVTINGSVSYAPQKSYVFPGSIRQNIVFHNKFDAARYDQVIEASGLSQDIQRFKNGDRRSVVGLSGGELARVSLARCLYHEANIYLLDDPLSAVDTGVSKHIFAESFKNFLGEKLRLVVTHQVHYLREADYVIVVDNGRIVKQGTPIEVEETVTGLIGKITDAADVDSVVPTKKAEINGVRASANEQSSIQIEEEKDKDDDDEDSGEGSLGLKIYWKYFKSGKSNAQLFIYLGIFIIAQIFTTLIEYWLAKWTNAEEKMYETSLNTTIVADAEERPPFSWDSFESFLSHLDNLEQRMYLYIYLILTIIVFLTNLAKAVAFFQYSMRICTNIHERMLKSLLRAEPAFFDKNHSGRIMNRLTKDVSVIDEAIPFAFFDFFTIFLQVITVIALIIFAIWYSVVAVIVFLLALGYVRGYYVTTSRELKRIDGTTRSPVISHLQATFSGLVTVRALEAEAALSNQFDYLQDENTSATISFLAASQCFNIWIEILATFLLTVVAFGFLLAQNYLGMTFLGGNVGLAICSALSLTIWLQYGMKTSANVENLMISVERALQYTKLKPEAPLKTPEDKNSPTGWPNDGSIKFNNVSLSYDGVQDILQKLSFSINAKEKIGIVGKTGAGKSSVLRALFRMTEVKNGGITIDNLSISGLGLHSLRKNLAIIPQKPQLFKATLAFNLYPHAENKKDDQAPTREQMKKVLETIGLRKELDSEVEMNGDTYSMGEQQLVSVARAMILKRQIVCMDEATAHVDSGTDNHIQKILREQLSDRTVITIAHRLGTVIEYDKILVLQNGQLVNPDGQLSQMVDNMGKDAESLKQRAADSYEAWVRKNGNLR
ncbi:Multidrug resistance-associated protein 4 [Orchesella cincta]|uniref:Multidrug resistance-associated protein 4 n=1 Tax=Orchesella cincta TaxID=48709 RepID=A0A1D2MPZ9_ORCCI|nr:Multidrug resistance-associated protein 4 [Orchesella cincta]